MILFFIKEQNSDRFSAKTGNTTPSPPLIWFDSDIVLLKENSNLDFKT